MTSRKTQNGFVIRLFQGEKLVESLTKFCEREKIGSAFFHGLGAVRNASMGYYALSEKVYHFTQYRDDFELVSLTGNVALVDDASFLHVHAVISDTQNRAYGGHVEEMEAAITVEIVMQVFDEPIKRELDEAIGLKLMEL